MPGYLHHNNVDALLWLQSSAEWRASYLQAYELARLRVDNFMRQAPAHGQYCITSDLDETLFDNSAYNEWLVTSGHNFNETGSWEQYCREEISLAMPGVTEFYSWLTKTWPQVAVFFVTSRLNPLRNATARNLTALIGNFAANAASTDPLLTPLFMKGLDVTLPDGITASDKYSQYRFIEDVLRHKTILRLGDNASDFHADFSSGVSPSDRLAKVDDHASEWGRTWIQMPNPVYGSFLLSMKNADGKAITEDEWTAKGMTNAPTRDPRTFETTPKTAFLDPWKPQSPVT